MIHPGEAITLHMSKNGAAKRAALEKQAQQFATLLHVYIRYAELDLALWTREGRRKKDYHGTSYHKCRPHEQLGCQIQYDVPTATIPKRPGSFRVLLLGAVSSSTQSNYFGQCHKHIQQICSSRRVRGLETSHLLVLVY